ncbi:MAG: type I methionyl aminopeptidase [Chloroflexi bacterium]|nr:type I methionyl aminopeptidase [Chloroflexota bacterium]
MWRRGIERKSRRELALMREAGRINALALQAARAVIRPGVSTADVDAAAAEVLRKYGARPAFLGYPGPYPYPAVTNVCVNEELVHAIPGRRRLKEGDIVTVDCGTVVDEYCSDAAFTAGVGEISPGARRLLEVAETALYIAIDLMRAENRTGDVSAAIQQYVEGHGYYLTREYTGHGVGRGMHEDPQIPNCGKAGRGPVLRPGITVALEPMVLMGTDQTIVLSDRWTVISKDHSLTAHFEHTVAVTEGEPLLLTALDLHERELAPIPQHSGRLAVSLV